LLKQPYQIRHFILFEKSEATEKYRRVHGTAEGDLPGKVFGRAVFWGSYRQKVIFQLVLRGKAEEKLALHWEEGSCRHPCKTCE
jgi:hypothetical protein